MYAHQHAKDLDEQHGWGGLPSCAIRYITIANPLSRCYFAARTYSVFSNQIAQCFRTRDSKYTRVETTKSLSRSSIATSAHSDRITVGKAQTCKTDTSDRYGTKVPDRNGRRYQTTNSQTWRRRLPNWSAKSSKTWSTVNRRQVIEKEHWHPIESVEEKERS